MMCEVRRKCIAEIHYHFFSCTLILGREGERDQGNEDIPWNHREESLAKTLSYLKNRIYFV
jgi:hypothetical protein